MQLWFRPRDADLPRIPAMPAFIHLVDDRAYYGLPLADPLPIEPSEPA